MSDSSVNLRIGLLQSCISIYGRKEQCFINTNLTSEFMITLVLIVLGIVCVTGAVILLALSSWNPRVVAYARWVGFTAMILFCLAAVVFPLGFGSEQSIGGDSYQLPSSHQV